MTIFSTGDRIISLSPALRIRAQALDVANQWWLSGGISAVNCIAAYQPKGAVDLAASYINLTGNATYNAAPGVAPTWGITNGWIFNGINQYLITGVIPASDNTWSLIIRYSGVLAAASGELAGAICGAPNTNRFYLRPWSTANAVLYGAGAANSISPQLSSGVLAVVGLQGYRNGTADGSPSTNGTGNLPTIYIGCSHYSVLNIPDGFLASNIQALSIYNVTLTAPQILALTTAMAAL